MTLSNVAVNTEADALGNLMSGAMLGIYTGTAPARPEVSIRGTLLVSLRLPGFRRAADGVIEAEGIQPGRAVATGQAGWFRIFRGSRVIMDGTVGTRDADLILNSVDIGVGSDVGLSSFVHRVTR